MTPSEAKGRRAAGGAEDDAGDLPAAVPSMIRVVKHGYHAEPRLLWASLAMTTLEALPDVLVGIWLALVTDGLVHHHETRLYVGAAGLAVSATLMWALSVTLEVVMGKGERPRGYDVYDARALRKTLGERI